MVLTLGDWTVGLCEIGLGVGLEILSVQKEARSDAVKP